MRQDNYIETIETNLKKSEIELNKFRNLLKTFKDNKHPKYRSIKANYKNQETCLYSLLAARKFLQEKLCVLKLGKAGGKE